MDNCKSEEDMKEAVQLAAEAFVLQPELCL